jgi:hypothetical protein
MRCNYLLILLSSQPNVILIRDERAGVQDQQMLFESVSGYYIMEVIGGFLVHILLQ